MKRLIAGISAATLLAAGAAHAQALKKITLFGQPSVNNDSIWMAIEHGYFKEQGLEVDYRVFPSGTTALQTFRTGQGDIVMTGTS
jgi:ABC-type nitrate/sulfonate/bicarbonate transport system substrate-binding protein